MICPYCWKKAKFVNNSEIYWRSYWKSYMAYYCKEDDAYVGTHKNSRKSLGTMANKELRERRKKAHRVLDPLWKSWKISRWWIYKELADNFWQEVHVGQSDILMCKNIINYINYREWVD